MSRVVVVGCGQIGLPLALAFVEVGQQVLGVDASPTRLAALVAGRLDPDDEGLSDRLEAGLRSGLLTFADAPRRAEGPGAFILTVPTPIDRERRFVREPLEQAVAAVTNVARDGDLIVVRSTVPIGTTRALAAKTDEGLLWAACPDRSVAGRAFADQFEIPHVAGGLGPAADHAAHALFARLGAVRSVASPEAAEALKLFANVQRDVEFALANSFALICEAAGVDFAEVREAGVDGFARFALARPGPVGGPCLSKDVFLLVQPASGPGGALLLAAREVNASLVQRLCAAIAADLNAANAADAADAGKVVAILGLAFKGRPAVRDRAESFGVALELALGARDAAITVRTWDPVSDPPPARAEAVKGARVVVLANDHAALADLTEVARAAPGAVVYDLCGVADRGSAAGLMLRVFGGGAGDP